MKLMFRNITVSFVFVGLDLERAWENINLNVVKLIVNYINIKIKIYSNFFKSK